jgi:hypothetical protein
VSPLGRCLAPTLALLGSKAALLFTRLGCAPALFGLLGLFPLELAQPLDHLLVARR